MYDLREKLLKYLGVVQNIAGEFISLIYLNAVAKRYFFIWRNNF